MADSGRPMFPFCSRKSKLHHQTASEEVITLTDHERSLLFKSWKDDFNSLYELGTNIYAEIFSKAPDAKKLFPALANWPGDIRDCPQFSSQALKFVQVISLALRYLDRPEKLNEMLRNVGQLHARYTDRGFRMAHWDIFLDAIVCCMHVQMANIPSFDDSTKEEAAAVWRSLAVYIIKEMRLGYVNEMKRIKVHPFT
uniref:GLOBIN domain-containing protein n=1 Tax=Trichuris muris TaxID=70415 RepID=A0A5S6QDI2_TRIMR